MFSYLNPQQSSSSSSSTKDTPDAEKLAAAKLQMLAIPSGLLGLNTPSLFKRRSTGRKSRLISKTYNTVSARPLADKLNKLREYTVHLRVDNTFITSSSTVPTFGAFNINLSNLANSAIYTACFDQYKIEEVEVWIEPSAGAANIPTNVGLLCTSIDLDDSTAPTSFSTLESSQTALVTNAMAGHYHKFCPHMAVAVYSGAFTSFANAPADWIDCGSPSVQHYGIKGAITDTSYVSIWKYNVRAKVSFRQTL